MNDTACEALPPWEAVFLAELAATSHVGAAAKKAGVDPATAYKERRQNIVFSRQWRGALCEGYENLEMELLHRLRFGEIKPAAGAKKATRTFENATALRMLAAYQVHLTQERARSEDSDGAAIIAAINTKLDQMQERHFGAEPIEGHDE